MTQDFINNKTVENPKKHPWMLRVLKKFKEFYTFNSMRKRKTPLILTEPNSCIEPNRS